MKTITGTELKSILDQHQLWIESAGKQGTCASLEGANLEDAYLRGANLTGAILRTQRLDFDCLPMCLNRGCIC